MCALVADNTGLELKEIFFHSINDALNEGLQNPSTGCIFSLVPPRKVLSMELVPPNSEQITKLTEDSNIPTKKVKVEVIASQTFLH